MAHHRSALSGRLDDVLRDLVPAALWLAGALKVADTALTVSWELAAWLAIPVLTMLWRFRLGAALLAVALLPWALLSGSSHPVLIVFVAALVAIFPDDGQRRLLFRMQLTALWGFAGLSKLTSSAWMSGDVVGGLQESLPVMALLPVVVVVWGAVLLEIGAAVLLWVDERAALVSGVCLHISIVVGMWPHDALLLIAFNGLALAMVVALYAAARGPTSAIADEDEA